MKHTTLLLLLLFFLPSFAQKIPNYSPDMQKENLGRGFVAYRGSKSGSFTTTFLSWRYLETDSINKTFKIYKAPILGGVMGSSTLIQNVSANSTFHKYSESLDSTMRYFLYEEINGVESTLPIAEYTLSARKTSQGTTGLNYIEIPMQAVKGVKKAFANHTGGTTNVWVYDDDSTDESFEYIPNDASFADLDGDGEMEIVVHRVGKNAQDNANAGQTDSPVLQAYKLDGTFMWEINLGINIREGAHYTQFMVYDLDGDGKAEVVCKTAEGSRDALGTYCGEAYFPTYVQKFNLGSRTYNRNANYRNLSGYILSGPEFLTVFNGETGAEITTIEYDPPRYSSVYDGGNEVPVLNPTGSNINSRWGDDWGNRCDRFLACVAYLDGIRPSVVMCRGYYSRTVLVAYDFDGTNLTKRWKFDTYNNSQNTNYAGQGNHNLSVADVDGDGKDEIIYGSCAIDDDGKGLYTTRRGHGDAMHVTDFIPERPGLEVLRVYENKGDNAEGTSILEARTGTPIFDVKSPEDVGRGMGTDISANHRGMEWWSSRSDVRNSVNGGVISGTSGVSMNMACWWDGDLLRELQDGTSITKYNNGSATTLFEPLGVSSNNGSKSNPCIVGDIIGDWREELVVRATNNRSIRIYMTDQTTNYRFHSFLQDHVYRMGIVWQNVAYNQPAHTGFYFGSDLNNIFVPTNIVAEGDSYELNAIFDQAISYKWNTDDSTQIITIERENDNDTLPHKIVLEMNYRGWIFKDSLNLSFAPKPASISKTETGKIALLTNPVKTEMNISFDEAGIYDLFFYDLAGRLTMKTTLVVGGRSIQTVDVSAVPAGAGVLSIENSKTKFKEKFLKQY